MESTPSSVPDTPAALPPAATATAADESWVRSRRVQTFALGALVGALALSLVVVVTAVFAAVQGQRSPVPADPAPVAETRVTPRPTTPAPTPMLSPSPTVPPAETETEAAGDELTTEPVAEPVVEPAPVPAPTVPEPAEEADASDDPGNSGTAPGRTKEPKRP
jgi:hypothetical protein